MPICPSIGQNAALFRVQCAGGLMMFRNSPIGCATAALLMLCSLIAPARSADQVKEVRLYALDCGRIQLKDMGLFSDTGEYDGRPGSIVDPCWVIRHPK